MKLLELKKHLSELTNIAFELPNGNLVPSHFHVTEVGKITKDFIDCGGVLRKEEIISLQLWKDNDYDHRLHPEKLISILQLSENIFNLKNLDIEVEYQSDTIGKYGLEFNGAHFMLTPKLTDCLAKDNCGIPVNEAPEQESCCDPSAGCC